MKGSTEQRLSETTADVHQEGRRLDDPRKDMGEKILNFFDRLFGKS